MDALLAEQQACPNTSSPGGQAAGGGAHVGLWALTDWSFCLSSAAWVPERLPLSPPFLPLPSTARDGSLSAGNCSSGSWMREGSSICG